MAQRAVALNVPWLTGQAWHIKYLELNLISAKREMTSSRVGFTFYLVLLIRPGRILFILDRLGREKMERVFSTACRSISAILIRITGQRLLYLQLLTTHLGLRR